MYTPRIGIVTTMLLVAISTTLSAETIHLKDCVVMAIDEAKVAAQESGILTEVYAKEGQQVEKTAPLAQVDDKLALLQENVAIAELKVAQQESKNYISVDYAKATADMAYNEILRPKAQ